MASQADFWQGPTGTLPVVNANGNIFEESQISIAGQTVFNLLSFTYTPGQKCIWVFRRPVASDIGGEMLRRGVDYNETSSSQITLISGAASLGDAFTFIAFGLNQLIAPVVNNGIPQGGATGAVLQKTSNSDYAVGWVAQSAITTLLDAARQNIASASTVNLVPLQGTTRNINITGNIQIDGFQIAAGQVWIVRFSGALTLKNNANIATCTGADIITTSNASCVLRAIADNTVEILAYTAQGGPALASNMNTGPLGGRRNFFYNGGMIGFQRGSQTLAAAGVAIALDGWLNVIGGTTVAANLTQSAYAGSSTGFVLNLSGLTTTGATSLSVAQHIEARNSKMLSGKTVTVSGKIRHNALGSLTFSVGFTRPTATDNFTGSVAVGTGLPVVVPNGLVDTPFTGTITLGATDADLGLQISIDCNTTALTGVSVNYWDVQCEIGGIATPFEHHSFAEEDVEAKRYLYCSNPGAPKGGAVGFVSGVAVTTNILQCNMRFPVSMRTAPTITLWNNGVQNQLRNTGTGATQANAPTSFNTNVNGFSGIGFTSATLVVGASYDFDIIATAEI